MNSDTVPQTCVDARTRFVDMSPTEGDESHGERPQFTFTGEEAGYSRESTPPVCPDAVGSVDKYVGDVGVGDERGEDTELAGRQTCECAACGFGWGEIECCWSRWNGGGQSRSAQSDPRCSVGARNCVPNGPGHVGCRRRVTGNRPDGPLGDEPGSRCGMGRTGVSRTGVAGSGGRLVG